MASKMRAAHDACSNLITLAKAEQQRFTKPLHCEYCEALVSFVNGFSRHVGEDIVAVEPYFRLQSGNTHGINCRYNIQAQITIIARESDSDIIGALQENRYELRLLAVKTAIDELRESVKRRQGRDTNDTVKTVDRVYRKSESQLGSYINSAARVLKVRAACLEHAEIEDFIQLVFDGTRLPWNNFYFEYDRYFECFFQVTKVPQLPIAIHGAVRRKAIVRTTTGQYAVMDLARPSRTSDPGVLDVACFSIWSPDLAAFDQYKLQQEIVAFGVWTPGGIKENPNKRQGVPVRLYRNHELRLWPVTRSQVCAVAV